MGRGVNAAVVVIARIRTCPPPTPVPVIIVHGLADVAMRVAQDDARPILRRRLDRLPFSHSYSPSPRRRSPAGGVVVCNAQRILYFFLKTRPGMRVLPDHDIVGVFQ